LTTIDRHEFALSFYQSVPIFLITYLNKKLDKKEQIKLAELIKGQSQKEEGNDWV